MLLDTHYHLGFLPVAMRRGFLTTLASRKVEIVAQTLTPSSFLGSIEASTDSLARRSIGFHPWFLGSDDDADRELEVFARAVEQTRFVGEIGLDFSPRRLAEVPADLQLRVLRRLLAEVGRAASVSAAPYVLSIHAVHAASEVLDVLAELDLQGVVPVFHFFSGTSDELTRVIRSGGYISVNPRMLEGKRGRAYVTQVPADRLLLESDLPPQPAKLPPDTDLGQAVEAAARELEVTLARTVQTLTQLRGDDVAQAIEETQARLYGDGLH